jgi:hypothetical protein
LLDPRSSEEELANLGSACQHWGFFQVRIHFPCFDQLD